MRVWAESAYGIPPHQVVGSVLEVELEMQGGEPVLMRRPKIEFINDKAAKPIGIQRAIGRRPILACGNSDGDRDMLEWTAANASGLAVLVHHTDAEREWAYDRGSAIGGLDRALDQARDDGWVVVDMQRDWRRVFAFQEPR